MLRELPVSKVAIGMYVAELDRPWLGTPFPTQGFYVRDKDQIEQLSEICEVVFIDPRRVDRMQSYARRAAPPLRKTPARGNAASRIRPRSPVAYEDAAAFEDEVGTARTALDNAAEMFRPVMENLAQRGVAEMATLKRAVDPLVDSVLRNKDALVALTRMQRFDSYTYSHCISTSIWATLLGRQLGFPPDDIRDLALACSLQDVGKLKIPKTILNHPGPLEAEAMALVRRHVEFSLEMLAGSGDVPEHVMQTVRWHHERYDGSGYPDALSGDRIPIFARIAGVVDSYDAMISARPYAETKSSFEALLELRSLVPDKFQSELIEQFTQAVGIFPNGAMVELSSGEVAIVIAQNVNRRLRPKVMLIMDEMKRRRPTFLIRDLSKFPPEALSIARELSEGEFGLDPRDYFL